MKRATPAPWIGWFFLGFALAALFAAGIFAMVVKRSARGTPTGDSAAFVLALDLSPLDRAAVYHEGRLKSYDAFAGEILGQISGRNRIFGQPHDFTYLDMILRPERYETAPVIYVKHKGMRAEIAAALGAEQLWDAARQSEFSRSGLIEESALDNPRIFELMQHWASDLIRTAKHADAVMAARELKAPQVLLDLLRLIPPPSNDATRPWASLNTLWSAGATMRSQEEALLAGMDTGLQAKLRDTIRNLADRWRAQDAPKTSAAVADLATLLPTVAPDVYPKPSRMALQTLYTRSANITWGWLIYLLSVILLLMSVIYRWERARLLGMGVFAAAFTLHTLALAWRWYVSGRWPNSNMFEAVTTSVWLGTVAVLVIEFAARRTPMRNLFALGGAVASMCAFMAAHFIPQLNSSINNMMPVLHDLWLYIHTNVIIASYALIAMAAATSLLYLGYRAVGGSAEYARVGGAATLMDISDAGMQRGASLARRATSAGEVFDGATMVLMELSFVLLWSGIVMGAIWADHSWGRPWGWDPKEVFALNTFLVFLILVHVRLKVRDKGLWTAVLALCGCAVMLFNWIVINFIISGLHSYA